MVTSIIGAKVNVNVPVTVSDIEAPGGSANFALNVPRSAVANYVKDGSDLVIEFDDGRVLRIRNYFAHGDNYNDLVFEADAGSEQQGVWVSDFSRAVGQGADGLADSLVSYTFVSKGSDAALLGLLGAVGLGGAVALAASGGGDDEEGGESVSGDITAPDAPRITASDPDGDGRINASGTAEPGSTVTVTWPDGSTSTVTVDASGNWSVESSGTQNSGTVTVVATDASGNMSPPAEASVDMDAPATPTLSSTMPTTTAGSMRRVRRNRARR
jgi:hypothetical protein